MVPLTLNAADMKALVSYVTSLGGTSASPARPLPGRPRLRLLKRNQVLHLDRRRLSPQQYPRLPDRPQLRRPKRNRRRQPDHRKRQLVIRQAAATAAGEEHFRFSRLRWMPRRERRWRQRASADSYVQSISASSIDSVLKAPTPAMKAAGMVPLTVNAADMEALVSYVSSLGGTSAASAADTPAAGSSSPAH